MCIRDRLGYSPDASGRTFRTGKKMMIGLVVPDITNSVFAALIEDVDDVISKQGYNLVISNTRDNLRMEKQALRSLASGVVDGIVIASTAEDFQTIKSQMPDKFPLVFMDRVLPDRNYDSVIYDCREATTKMLEEMMGKGIAARFGGEEFMLVFEQDDREQVLHSFRNIQEGLKRYSQNTRQTDITISGGMERYEADKQLDLLFTSVDRKLYTAKNSGKNRIVE